MKHYRITVIAEQYDEEGIAKDVELQRICTNELTIRECREAFNNIMDYLDFVIEDENHEVN